MKDADKLVEAIRDLDGDPWADFIYSNKDAIGLIEADRAEVRRECAERMCKTCEADRSSPICNGRRDCDLRIAIFGTDTPPKPKVPLSMLRLADSRGRWTVMDLKAIADGYGYEVEGE